MLVQFYVSIRQLFFYRFSRVVAAVTALALYHIGTIPVLYIVHIMVLCTVWCIQNLQVVFKETKNKRPVKFHLSTINFPLHRVTYGRSRVIPVESVQTSSFVDAEMHVR